MKQPISPNVKGLKMKRYDKVAVTSETIVGKRNSKFTLIKINLALLKLTKPLN